MYPHRFVPYDAASPNSKLQAEMRRLADQDTAGWLLTEMAENRDKLRVSAPTAATPWRLRKSKRRSAV